MGTERFTRVTPVSGNGDKIKPVAQAWGDRVQAQGLVNSPGVSDHIQPAGLFSTAPYVPIKTTGCLGKGGACQARPVLGTKYCYFHSPNRAAVVKEQ